MGHHGYSLNSTNAMNDSSNFDPFCTDMLVGPLVWGIFSVPTACVGVPASVWLLWVLIQKQRSGSSNNLYMLNLTIMDLVFNLIVIPNVLNYLVWHDHIVFLILVFFYSFNCCGRPLFMSCICVDCYMAVVLPITYMKIKNGRYRMVTCALVWGFTLAVACMFVQGLSVVIPISLGLSAPIIVFSNLSIICALRKPDPSGRSDIHPQKQRARQSIFNSLVMTFVSYFPLIIVYGFLHNLLELSAQEQLCILNFPCLMSSTFGSTILPLLYLGNLGCLKDIRLICGRMSKPTCC